MMKLTGIKISNFRVFPFTENQEDNRIDLSYINLITGANSSGKSSFFKALLLLQDNWERYQLLKLDFTDRDHKLGSFKSVQNDPEKDELAFTLFFGDGISLTYEFEGDENQKEGILRRFIFQDNGKVIVEIMKTGVTKKRDNTYDVKELDMIWFEFGIKQEIESMDESVVWEEVITQYVRNLEKEIVEDLGDKLQEIIDFNDNDAEEKLRKERKKKISEVEVTLDDKEKQDIEKDIQETTEIIKCLNNQVLENSKEIENVKKQLLEAKEEDLISELEQKRNELEQKGDKLEDDLSQIEEKKKQVTVQKLREKKDAEIEKINKEFDMKEEELGQKDEEQKEDEFIDRIYSYLQSLEGESSEKIDEISPFLASKFNGLLHFYHQRITHLPAFRAEQRRIFALQELEENYQKAIRRFWRIDEKGENFIRKWFKEFEVGYDYLSISNVEDAGGTFRIWLVDRETEKMRNLADMGFGISQLIPIILVCATVQEGEIISIEEPETNLHPKFQSRLAEMFFETSQKGVQVMLETHSEYLMRNLQYLIAKQKLTHEDVKIYYFNKIDTAENNELIQRIPIGENGDIEEDYEKYWKGFYDEATTLTDKKIFVNVIKQHQKRCIVATEDTDTKMFELLLEASGFNMEETEIISYRTCAKVDIALGMAEMARKYEHIQKVIIHQDSDGEFGKRKAELEKYKNNNKLAKLYVFITEYNDIEGYFINAKHIHNLYPKIPIEEVEKIIQEVTQTVREKSIANLSKKLGGNRDIAEEAFDNCPEKYRHTKEMKPKINKALDHKKIQSPNIIQKSEFIKVRELEAIAEEIWH